MYEPNLMEASRSIDLKVGPGKPDVQEQGLEYMKGQPGVLLHGKKSYQLLVQLSQRWHNPNAKKLRRTTSENLQMK